MQVTVFTDSHKVTYGFLKDGCQQCPLKATPDSWRQKCPCGNVVRWFREELLPYAPPAIEPAVEKNEPSIPTTELKKQE